MPGWLGLASWLQEPMLMTQLWVYQKPLMQAPHKAMSFNVCGWRRGAETASWRIHNRQGFFAEELRREL